MSQKGSDKAPTPSSPKKETPAPPKTVDPNESALKSTLPKKDEFQLITVVNKEGEDIAHPIIPVDSPIIRPVNEYVHKENLLAWYCAFVADKCKCDRSIVCLGTVGFLFLNMLNCSPGQAYYLSQVISIAYPIFITLYTIEGEDNVESYVWMLYWVLWTAVNLGGFTRLENNLALTLLTGLFAWLWCPITDGIHFVYHGFVRALVMIQHGKFEKEVWEKMHPSVRRGVQRLGADAKQTLKKYMDEDMLDALNEAQVIQLLESAASKNKTVPSETAENQTTDEEKEDQEEKQAEEALIENLFQQMSTEQLQHILDIAKTSKEQQEQVNKDK